MSVVGFWIKAGRIRAAKIAKARGHKRACVAVARKLAVIMFAMWRDGSEFRFKEPKAQAGRSATSMPKLIGVTA